MGGSFVQGAHTKAVINNLCLKSQYIKHPYRFYHFYVGENSMISQGLILMVVGMGVVFIFLTLMVLLMKLSALVVRKISPELPALSPVPSVNEGELVKVAVAVLAAKKNQDSK